MHEREGWSLLFSLAGLVVLRFLAGGRAALWVAMALLVSIGVTY